MYGSTSTSRHNTLDTLDAAAGDYTESSSRCIKNQNQVKYAAAAVPSETNVLVTRAEQQGSSTAAADTLTINSGHKHLCVASADVGANDTVDSRNRSVSSKKSICGISSSDRQQEYWEHAAAGIVSKLDKCSSSSRQEEVVHCDAGSSPGCNSSFTNGFQDHNDAAASSAVTEAGVSNSQQKKNAVAGAENDLGLCTSSQEQESCRRAALISESRPVSNPHAASTIPAGISYNVEALSGVQQKNSSINKAGLVTATTAKSATGATAAVVSNGETSCDDALVTTLSSAATASDSNEAATESGRKSRVIKTSSSASNKNTISANSSPRTNTIMQMETETQINGVGRDGSNNQSRFLSGRPICDMTRYSSVNSFARSAKRFSFTKVAELRPSHIRVNCLVRVMQFLVVSSRVRQAYSQETQSPQLLYKEQLQTHHRNIRETQQQICEKQQQHVCKNEKREPQIYEELQQQQQQTLCNEGELQHPTAVKQKQTCTGIAAGQPGREGSQSLQRPLLGRKTTQQPKKEKQQDGSGKHCMQNEQQREDEEEPLRRQKQQQGYQSEQPLHQQPLHKKFLDVDEMLTLCEFMVADHTGSTKLITNNLRQCATCQVGEVILLVKAEVSSAEGELVVQVSEREGGKILKAPATVARNFFLSKECPFIPDVPFPLGPSPFLYS